jgi:ABC-2 type transport system permease protein
MSRLLAGELQRVLARRLVRVLALVAVAGIALAGVLVFLNTDTLSAPEAEARRTAAQTRVEACLRGEPVQIRGGPVRQVPPDLRAEVCASSRVAGVDDPRFRLRGLKGILQGTTAPLVIVGWLIGASMIGADWQTRTLTTLLTWEPRRLRVLLVKVLACLIVAAAFTLLAQALLSAALLPSAWWHGTTAGTGGTWLRSVAGVVLRGMLLVSIATAIGFAVASIGRNTAAALGIGFAYFLIIENVAGSFLAGLRRWLLLGNAIVLIAGRDSGGDVPGRSVVAAALFLIAVAVGLLMGATVLFARRDVA